VFDRCEYGDGHSGFIKGEKVFCWVSECKLLSKNCGFLNWT
jgi:hypothetical protein